MNYFINKKLLFSFRTLGVLFGLLILPSSTSAAEILFSASSQELPLGQTLQVDINLKPEGESVNAVGAALDFPASLLEFQGVRDGGSIINFWVEVPYLATDNSLVFSGITPGGFMAGQGLVLSVLFRTKAEGQAVLKLSGIEVLKNDGTGSAIPIADQNLLVNIAKSAPDSQVNIPSDVEPPEPFVVNLGKNSEIFDGRWFVAFATADKNSGIHHYEIAERRGPLVQVSQDDTKLRWHSASSPYVLRDQSLKSGIYVRAIDRAGNSQVAVLAPQIQLAWYENYRVYGIILIILVAAVIIKKLWRVIAKK